MYYEFKADERFKIIKSEHSEQDLQLFYQLIEIGFIELHEEDQLSLELSYTNKAMHLIKHS